MHRTTARGALLLTLLTALSLAAVSTSSAVNDPDPPDAGGSSTMIFPVVGAARYTDDYGDPRGQGRHAGNDILTTWRSPAVAAEDGTIKFWTTSARAGCMLYLYGASGTTYLYIHLNNDLTAKRDNKGKCVPGTAYATGLKNGARVKAGQQIAYNGDSGDAEGIYHLHFEVHPKDGSDVDPFPYLNDWLGMRVNVRQSHHFPHQQCIQIRTGECGGEPLEESRPPISGSLRTLPQPLQLLPPPLRGHPRQPGIGNIIHRHLRHPGFLRHELFPGQQRGRVVAEGPRRQAINERAAFRAGRGFG
jgi:hypothetical protein